MAICSLAVLIGTSENVTAVPKMSELAERFDPASTSKSSSKFDPADLTALNRTLLQSMSFAEARDRLAAFAVSGPDAEEFWLAVRGNIDTLAEAAVWWRILREGPQQKPDIAEGDIEFVRSAFDLLPAEPWDSSTWKTWTNAVKEATGRKGKPLFMPLRLAITGRSSGPELAELLPFLDREGTLARRP
jgi:glutamyl-tRNA synthetase